VTHMREVAVPGTDQAIALLKSQSNTGFTKQEIKIPPYEAKPEASRGTCSAGSSGHSSIVWHRLQRLRPIRSVEIARVISTFLVVYIMICHLAGPYYDIFSQIELCVGIITRKKLFNTKVYKKNGGIQLFMLVTFQLFRNDVDSQFERVLVCQIPFV
jgi:hypothetical protein